MTRTARRPARPAPTRLVVAGLLAAVVGALIMAALTAGPDQPASSPRPDSAGPSAAGPGYGVVEVTGMALPRLPDGATPADDPAVGMAAPVVRGIGIDGSDVVIGEGPALVALLAHWCPHCQDEVPVVVDWVESGGLPDGVALAAVATSTDPGQPNFPPDAWLERERWSAPALLDGPDHAAGVAYGLTRFPFWVVIDGDGAVVARVPGVLEADQLAALAEAALG